MSGAENEGGLDLYGLWQGIYSYPSKRKPIAFSATLTETGFHLVGTSQEIGTFGDANGQVLGSSLDGRRSGRSVTWLKLYHGTWRRYDAVHYSGEVSTDGNEISGTWTIPGNWSGNFLMIRAGGGTEEEMLEAFATISAPARR